MKLDGTTPISHQGCRGHSRRRPVSAAALLAEHETSWSTQTHRVGDSADSASPPARCTTPPRGTRAGRVSHRLLRQRPEGRSSAANDRARGARRPPATARSRPPVSLRRTTDPMVLYETSRTLCTTSPGPDRRVFTELGPTIGAAIGRRRSAPRSDGGGRRTTSPRRAGRTADGRAMRCGIPLRGCSSSVQCRSTRLIVGDPRSDGGNAVAAVSITTEPGACCCARRLQHSSLARNRDIQRRDPLQSCRRRTGPGRAADLHVLTVR